MEKIGAVKGLVDDLAIIEIRRASACGEKCGSCKGGCSPTAIYVKVKNDVNAKIGQYVKLKSEPKKILKAAFLVYIIPLIALILGLIAGSEIASFFGYSNISEAIGAASGFLALALSYAFLKAKDRKIKASNELVIVISHIIH